MSFHPAYLRIVLVSFLAICMAAPAPASNIVFRFKNDIVAPADEIPVDVEVCQADGSGECDNVCDPQDHAESPDCREQTDDNDQLCEAGEDGRDSDCNEVCDHWGEVGSPDCEGGEFPDHEPVDELFNADMEVSAQSAWRSSEKNSYGTPSVNETWSDKQIGGLRYMSVTNPASPPYQDVEVPDGLAASGFGIAYNWLQAGNTEAATGAVEAVFLNEAKAELGRLTPDIRAISRADMWVERKAEGAAPAGTKFVRIVMTAGVAGAQFDNIDLRIQGVKYSTINGRAGMPDRPQDRLYDASTEFGANGVMGQMFDTKWWRRTDGATQLFLSEYVNQFRGASTRQFSTTCCSGGAGEYNQMVYVGPGNGGRTFWLEWFQSGSPTRHGSVRAEFFGRYEGVLLGAVTPAHAGIPNDAGTKAFRSVESVMPQGTEFIRVTFKVDRNSAIADIGMGIGNENWSRRGILDTSGVPTTCEYLSSHNGAFEDAEDGHGYSKYWALSSYRVRQHVNGGNSAAIMEYAGGINQMICVPRANQKSFNGVFWALHNIRTNNTANGGQFIVDFYNSDMEIVHTGYTGMVVDGLNGGGVTPHFGYVGAYGTISAPALRFDDIVSFHIRSQKSNGDGGLYTIFDNVMFGDGPVSLPGYEIDWEPTIMSEGATSYRR